MRRALLTALAVRLLGALILPQTFFQPDEYYQALEPAHRLVFGYGYLTWEWKDLPAVLGSSAGTGWWDEVVVQGRMRSWLWPGVFALVYKAVQAFGLAHTAALVIAPQIVGALVAAMTDFATYRLAIKVLGHGAGETAMFLSLTSPFNAFVLPRVLSTSPETLLVTLALTYFPLPQPERPNPFVSDIASASGIQSSSKKAAGTSIQAMISVEGEKLDQGVLDRAGPDLVPRVVIGESLAVSAVCAALAVCLRPTTLPFWAYLGLEHTWSRCSCSGISSAFKDIAIAFAFGACVIAASTGLDYAITGRLSLPILTFIHRNLLMNISAFYGKTNYFYHLTQSLPILVFPHIVHCALGFAAALLPRARLPALIAQLDRPAPLRLLARAVTFAVFALSLSPHSEWRFLHPFLPVLLLFAIPTFFKNYRPVVPFGTSIVRTFRQYLRIPFAPFCWTLLSCAILMAYLGIFHGRAQVAVMDVLRSGKVGEVTGLAALMPCHSTPWMSHLHKDIPAWFLTCEPPLHGNSESHTTQQALFYASPVSYLEEVFPYPVMPLHGIPDHFGDDRLPSHVILFDELLSRSEDIAGKGALTVKDALEKKGYKEVWSGWNGFEWAQDELERRGRVKIWAL